LKTTLFASPQKPICLWRVGDPGASRLSFGGNAYRMSTLSRHRDLKVSESCLSGQI